MGPFGLICGATYLLPNNPMKPAYPPGSSGSRSASPPLAVEQSELVAAQWTPMPTKSENAWQSGGFLAQPGSEETSAACGDVAPKTVGMSVAMFSSTVFAVATWPTLHPARVEGTHGAGA